MADKRLRNRRALAALTLVTLVGGIGGGLVWLVHLSLTGGLQVAADWAQLGSVVLAVGAVAPVITAAVAWWRRGEPSAVMVATADQVDHAHRTLAGLVLGQWREEIGIRQLDDPTSLAVRWRLTELPVMDLHDHVFRPNSLRALLGRGRHRLSVRSDRIGELAEEFRQLPRRRLVLLGGPGMGKTTLAILLLHELLRRYEPGQPVPVLLSMSDWHPGEESLHAWFARRLTETYPVLRADDFGPGMATTMITQRRVLPVLDGLDELPEWLRPDVLAALNAALTADDPLILTCRTAEYEAAINRPDGAVLTGGAVIEPDPLRPSDITAYLQGRQRVRAGGGWPEVFSALTDPNKPIAQALTSPLDLWLLRKVYIETGVNPRELLETSSFPTAAKITDHLLDHLVHAAITANPPHRDIDRPSSLRPQHSWDPDAAQRWLSFLAYHLHTTKSHDIAWWRLHAVPGIRLIHRLVGGLALGSVFGSVVGLMGMLGGGLVAEPRAGFTGGLLGGFTIGPILGLAAKRLSSKPAYVSLRLRGRARALARKITRRAGRGAAVGLTPVFVSGLIHAPVVAVLAFGLMAGAMGGLVIGVLEWVATPVLNDLAQTPVSTLRRDLQLSFGRTILALLAGGFLFGLLAGFVGGSAVMLTLGLEAVGAVLLIYGPVRWTVTASSVYLGVVVVFRTQRRAPLRMMRFLDDAHRAGLLRQVGPVYQFRHAKLQNRLAHTYRQRTRRPLQ